jgi:hypothetical protein
MGQEMSLWKSRNLSVEKDVFIYYLSLNHQVTEQAFGLLDQRWGIFWHPLRLSMHNQGVAVCIACQLHNNCMIKIAAKSILYIKEQCQDLNVKQIFSIVILPLLFNSQMEPISDLATDLI